MFLVLSYVFYVFLGSPDSSTPLIALAVNSSRHAYAVLVSLCICCPVSQGPKKHTRTGKKKQGKPQENPTTYKEHIRKN